MREAEDQPDRSAMEMRLPLQVAVLLSCSSAWRHCGVGLHEPLARRPSFGVDETNMQHVFHTLEHIALQRPESFEKSLKSMKVLRDVPLLKLVERYIIDRWFATKNIYSSMTTFHPISVDDFSSMDDDALAAAVSTLAAHIHAATYRLLTLIAELDRREVWAAQGAMSCAHWLSWACGIDTHTAREKVRVARALTELPLLSEALAKGELGYSKVRALTRIATPRNEVDLLNIGLHGTAQHVEKFVRAPSAGEARGRDGAGGRPA